MMKKIFVALLLLSWSIVNSQWSMAQIGSWHNYLAYHDVQQIQAAGNELFIVASNNLYQYNKTDHSIYTYDKTKGLSDTSIKFIRWCQQAKRLVVVYSNSNIDLVETNGNVYNISEIYTKSITGGKEIHHAVVNGQYAYLSADFGVVKVNVKNVEISETYSLGFVIMATAIEGNNIYVKSQDESIWTADMSKNLIDPSNWTQTSSAPSFDVDETDYNNNIELVKTLQPGGPKYNNFGFMRVVNNRLITARGLMDGLTEPAYVQVIENNEWKQYLNETVAQQTGVPFINTYEIDSDPRDPNHVFASAQNGLYEIRNGAFVKFYNSSNSPIEAFSGNNYQLVTSIKFDASGNLWMLNSLAPTKSVIVLKNDGTFATFNVPELMKYTSSSGKVYSLPSMQRLYLDSRGLLWFVNANHNLPGIICYDCTHNKALFYGSFTNQDGTTYDRCYPYDVKEDLKGNIWIATNKGPFYIKKEDIGQATVVLYQEKVPRNDGTDLADYLLTGIPCNSIAIDGAGRKWIATTGYGVYLISEDNMTQVQHFTADNSCLLSNDVNYITINQQTGEVFFGTDKGLCSYVSDATEAATEMTKDNVWAYPNPVRPDYTGLITIVGLTLNADVKILAPNGALIYEGRSNGGTFTWNGCDKEGKRVASGVYMVATATSGGEKGTVCKIAIVR